MKHGTDTAYVAGCHCGRCRKAHAAAAAPNVKARGRALQALAREYPARFAELLAEERTQMGLRLERGRPRTAKCGTVSGAKRHYLDGERPCEPCRLARNAAKRERYARARGAA